MSPPSAPRPRRSITVRVRVEVLSAEPGGWCDRCFLPSAVAAQCAFHVGQSLHSMVEILWCEQCGPLTPMDAASLGFDT